jgi:hypothetical protein
MRDRIKSICLCVLMCSLLYQCYSRKNIMLPEGQVVPPDENKLLVIWQNQKVILENVHITKDSLYGERAYSNRSDSLVHIHLDSNFELQNAYAYKRRKFVIPTSAIENRAPYTVKYDASKSMLALLGSLGAVVGFLCAYYYIGIALIP